MPVRQPALSMSKPAKPRTLAQALGYDPKSFSEFNKKRTEALLQVEEREEKRIVKALQTKIAWQP